MTALSLDQRAVLQELTNIGMGQAGDSISRVCEEFVHLSIPAIELIDAAALPALVSEVTRGEPVAVARQAFHGGFRGEVFILISLNECEPLLALMGRDEAESLLEEHERFLDMANILAGACVSGLAHQLHTEVGFSPPALLGDRLNPSTAIKIDPDIMTKILSLEVKFAVEERKLSAYLLILFPEDEIHGLRRLLDQFLESLDMN